MRFIKYKKEIYNLKCIQKIVYERSENSNELLIYFFDGYRWVIKYEHSVFEFYIECFLQGIKEGKMHHLENDDFFDIDYYIKYEF